MTPEERHAWNECFWKEVERRSAELAKKRDCPLGAVRQEVEQALRDDVTAKRWPTWNATQSETMSPRRPAHMGCHPARLDSLYNLRSAGEKILALALLNQVLDAGSAQVSSVREQAGLQSVHNPGPIVQRLKSLGLIQSIGVVGAVGSGRGHKECVWELKNRSLAIDAARLLRELLAQDCNSTGGL